MAHELEIRNGMAQMFSVGQTPWHRLGRVIKDAPTIQEGIVAAELDWKVEMKPLFLESGKQVKNRAIVRDIDEKVLGVVGDKYKPLQNSQAFEWFDPFLANGDASLETAGSLKEGKRVWVLAKLNKDPFIVKGNDTINKYLMLANGHDGFFTIRCGFTPIRVVCANTMAAAIANSKSSLIRIRHSAKAEDALKSLQESVNISDASFEMDAEKFRLLASKGVCRGDIEKFVKIVFFPKIVGQPDERQANAIAEMNATITRLFETGRGSDLQEVRGTYWALYNAANEYLNYEAARNDDNRMESIWFGQNRKVDVTAFETVMAMAV